MVQTLLEMAKRLVITEIERYRLGPEAVREVLRNIHATLTMLRRQEEMGEVARESPRERVDWRRSITQQTVTCLECGERFKSLARHLHLHGLDAHSYRMKFGIPQGQALMARASSAKRRQRALEGRMREKAPRYRTTRRRGEQTL